MSVDQLLKIGTSATPVTTTSTPQVTSLVLGAASSNGIKVDTTTPTYPYRDLPAGASVKTGGNNDPIFAVFRDGLRAYQFANNSTNELYSKVHVPADYVMGTDITIQIEWAQNTVDTGGPAGVPGTVKWQLEFNYAKSFGQAAFPAAVTGSSTQQASSTQYMLLMCNIAITAATPSGSQVDSDLLEPGGHFMLRLFRDPADAADTLNQAPFLLELNIHYQSTGVGTKYGEPPFYA